MITVLCLTKLSHEDKERSNTRYTYEKRTMINDKRKDCFVLLQGS